MTGVSLLIFLLIGVAWAIVGQVIAGYSRGGCLASIVVGFVGALLGHWLARLLGLPTLFVVGKGLNAVEVTWPILGSALAVAVYILLVGRRAERW